MPAQLGICDFEGIQPVSAWLVKAERVGAGLRQNEQAKFLQFFDRGGVIVYYARHGAGMGALCFAVKILLHFN
ncbi:MAG: hypothetical protein ABIL62_14250 [Planctomycetota bacterium]